MDIVYVAKHDSGGNDDEGAIAFALRKLGHRVICVDEKKGYLATKLRGDLLLFHKWMDIPSLKKVRYPKVFWYFDLVDYPSDPTLASRCLQRKMWMQAVMPYIDLGFCTDGDWVANATQRVSNAVLRGTSKPPRNLVHLPQGVDERHPAFGYHGSLPSEADIPILFTGIAKGGGAARESFVAHMKETYGDGFHHVAKGSYGANLAALVARAKVVVAPPTPVSDRYWSNRVYLMLACGACLIHPYSAGLANDFVDTEYIKDLRYYHNMEQLHHLISYYLDPANDYDRTDIQVYGQHTVQSYHTYTHRCVELLRVCKERIPCLPEILPLSAPSPS